VDDQTAEGKKSPSLYMAELNSHIPVAENPHFIVFDISAFGSD
jgi:hypothetical protein